MRGQIGELTKIPSKFVLRWREPLVAIFDQLQVGNG